MEDSGLPEIGVAAAPPRLNNSDHVRKSRLLRADVIAGEYGMGNLMKAMRDASGLVTRQIAHLMGIERESLAQYFWQRVGKGGSMRLSWFLRYAQATGCRIYVTFPSNAEQYELKVKVQKVEANEAKKTERV